MSSSVSRRRLLQAARATAAASIGVSAHPLALGQVRLTASRWLDNQDRTRNYLRFVDADRLLYNFRANHRLPTNGATANGGWDAPDFPFHTHVQGQRTLSNGNVPYCTIHKTLAGLLDVWRHLGSTQARDVLLALAGWVDRRTGRLSAQ